MRNHLTKPQLETLLETLEDRFKRNMHRHPKITWPTVLEALMHNPEKCKSLSQMENTHGEPDVVTLPNEGETLCFIDCAAESPKGRRSLCYDQAALESRKNNKPADSAVHAADAMGTALLDEAQYQFLQSLEPFDQKTSSWLRTPDTVRTLGGALFGDYRFGRVFIYHNGAESYYAGRGFRTLLKF